MIKINDRSIFVGEIKQLLSSVNIPNCRIVKPSFFYEDGVGYDGEFVVCENSVFVYDTAKNVWKYSTNFHGQSIPNLTQNLGVTNVTYDATTHRFLGKYLRFLRDYKNINLMSLYNCMDFTVIGKGYFRYGQTNVSDGEVERFNNSSYVYYKVPVVIGNEYTIGVDSDLPYEIYAGVYRSGTFKSFVGDNNNFHKKIIGMGRIRHPYIYKELTTLTVTEKIGGLKQSDNVCLIIKMPVGTESNIVVLEGDYTKCCDVFSKNNREKLGHQPIFGNYYTFKVESKEKYREFPLDYVSRLELLWINSGEKYVLADKIVGYLTNNVISPLDDILNNINATQDYLKDYWSNVMRSKSLNNTYNFSFTSNVWGDNMTKATYLLERKEGVSDNCFDVLPYVDCDTEKAMNFLGV